METKGEFTHHKLPKLIRTAGERQLSCVMLFKTGNRSIRLYFQEGKIAFISSSDPDERFGEYLLYKGTISWEQYRETSDRIMKGEGKLGYLLVQHGFVSYEELLHSITQYILDLGTGLFQAKRGLYAFLRPEDPDGLPMELHMDHRRLIYEGIQRWDHYSLVEQIIPSAQATPDFVHSEDSVFRILEMGVEEQSILEWINGRNTAGSICSFSELPEFATLKVLAGLACGGFLEIREQQTEAESEQELEFRLEGLVSEFNTRFEKIYQYLVHHGEDVLDVVQNDATTMLKEGGEDRIHGLDIRNYGFLDFETIYRNVYNIPGEHRYQETEKLLDTFLKALVVRTGRNLGKPAQAELQERLTT